MTVEVATTIAELNDAWPLIGDSVNEGDNHIRLIKDVLKKQFPGINGNGFNIFIAAYESELNSLTGLSTNLQGLLDSVAGYSVPVGGIIMYSGTFANIPSNFSLCDGTNGTPNMSDEIAYGTNTQGELSNTGGSNDAIMRDHSHSFQHDHTAVTNDTGDHTHSIPGRLSFGANLVDVDYTTTGQSLGSPQIPFDNAPLHTHTVTVNSDATNTGNAGVSGTDKNIPPYLKLAHIQRKS